MTTQIIFRPFVREDVYRVIDHERDYQEAGCGNARRTPGLSRSELSALRAGWRLRTHGSEIIWLFGHWTGRDSYAVMFQNGGKRAGAKRYVNLACPKWSLAQ